MEGSGRKEGGFILTLNPSVINTPGYRSIGRTKYN